MKHLNRYFLAIDLAKLGVWDRDSKVAMWRPHKYDELIGLTFKDSWGELNTFATSPSRWKSRTIYNTVHSLPIERLEKMLHYSRFWIVCLDPHYVSYFFDNFLPIEVFKYLSTRRGWAQKRWTFAPSGPPKEAKERVIKELNTYATNHLRNMYLRTFTAIWVPALSSNPNPFKPLKR